jgi:DNA-binding response OmpR family regulator
MFRTKMTSETRSRQQRDGSSQHVDLPVLRSRGPRQSVILVADDEVLIRNLVTLLMQREGHFVLSAADGHEGLELSRKYPGWIDLLITDVQMPRLNGTDLCAHLLEERPGIRVLVMSGSDMSEIIRQNVNLLFLPKPFDGESLKAKVRAILAPTVQPPMLRSDPDRA